MEKRAILALALAFLVFIAFQYIQQWYDGHTVAPQPSKQAQSPAQEPATPPVPAQAEAAPAPALASAPVSAADTVAQPQKVVVATDIYRAVIDNRGAVLSSWELNKYKSARHSVFEMIAGNREGEARSFPGSMIFRDPSLAALANDELYQVSINGKPGSEVSLAAPVTVVLKLKRGDLTIEKRYSFEKDNYLLDLQVTCEKSGKALDGKVLLGQDIGPEYEHFVSSAKLGAVYFAGGKARRKVPPQTDGGVLWAGLEMQYFAMIAIPSQPLQSIDVEKRSVKSRDLKDKDVDRELVKVLLPTNGSFQCEIYLGPKKQSTLEAVKSANITGVIDYGMFEILVLPLLASLRWIYQFVHNYGYAIIVLTFLLSLLLFPFRLKQIVSMKKMQVVQPKVKAIQEKYRRYKKTDPKRAEMNKEIMALYKEHNVNPLGGCIPLVLQFPLLFAFYSLLANSIELRQAPFFGWLQDLSMKDPYYVLPLIMGVTMFISQKMTPMTPGTDPTQAKLMMVMPVIFTVMFFNVSSGLNLYFLCSNIFQIAFQKIAERWIGDGRSGERSKS